MLRRLVFGVLIFWALVDATLTAREMPTLFTKASGFLFSFGWSFLFIMLIFAIWNWLAAWCARRSVRIDR
jgi:hypothetical protein